MSCAVSPFVPMTTQTLLDTLTELERTLLRGECWAAYTLVLAAEDCVLEIERQCHLTVVTEADSIQAGDYIHSLDDALSDRDWLRGHGGSTMPLSLAGARAIRE
jgi:hypothetical protein